MKVVGSAPLTIAESAALAASFRAFERGRPSLRTPARISNGAGSAGLLAAAFWASSSVSATSMFARVDDLLSAWGSQP
jgi:hypothetical protein